MKEMARKNNCSVVAICHNIRSAYNVGSIFRTADGLGVSKIYLTGYTSAPPHPGIAKAALGAENFVSWEKNSRLSELILKLKKESYKIIAVEIDKKSKALYSFIKKGNICLVMGNEVRGLGRLVLSKCDGIAEIPMRGQKESLNVSVAFGIAVCHFLNQ
jgi:23S rRNA (guanosine2251-2'-O)-methyltransferase